MAWDLIRWPQAMQDNMGGMGSFPHQGEEGGVLINAGKQEN
jgi:hypothetical protein